MTRKLRVGVIFGGRSGEHEVSLRSARAVVEAMDKSKYEIIPIGISKEGEWRASSGPDALDERQAKTLRAENDNTPGLMTFLNTIAESLQKLSDPATRGLVTLDADKKILPAQPLDVIFPVLHGTYGEDGTLQGLLEMKNIPYVGCGVLASACGMDKVVMKSLFKDAGLPICGFTWFLRSAWEHEPEKVLRHVAREIGYPCFVKPANLGSSVGVSKAVDKQTLERAINLAARYDRKIVVEEGLDAREIECAVMGNDEAEASLPGEYVVHDKAAEFLDYAEKYTGTGHVEFVVPAPISKTLTTRIQKMAAQAFRAIDGSGLARVDFFLRRDNKELLVNEINTLPGLTEVSGYPKMWAATGRPFSQVIDRLLELAIERHKEKSRNETSL